MNDEGQQCRKKVKGYKYVFKDLVLYTQYDVRDGIEEAGFTESVTGMYTGLGAALEKRYEDIKQAIKELPPVISLPVYHEKKEHVGFDVPDSEGNLLF